MKAWKLVELSAFVYKVTKICDCYSILLLITATMVLHIKNLGDVHRSSSQVILARLGGKVTSNEAHSETGYADHS